MLIPLEGLDIVLSVVTVIYNFFCHTLKDIIVQIYEYFLKSPQFGCFGYYSYLCPVFLTEMRRIENKIVCGFIAALVAMVLPSCRNEVSIGLDDGFIQTGSFKVGFYAGSGVQTRTQMLEDGLSATWADGDVLSLWAKSSSGSYALSNQHFRTYGVDSELGFFTSDLSSPMEDDTYTYYCCYPVPESVNGTKVTFNLPSVQDGKASSGADIMIADPVVHDGGLTAIPEPEDHSGMSMEMNRMMHQFRFYIPAENTVIGNEKIERILLTFPSGVTGKVTLDFADPDVAAVLSEESANAELRLAEPIGISTDSPQFACFAMAPKQFAAGEKMQIKAYTKDRIAYFDDVDLQARNFLAGHSTPVLLNVKELKDYPYFLRFNISQNNLGEGVNTVILEAPEGCDWDGTGSNVYTYTPGYQFGTNHSINFRFENEAQYRKFSKQTIKVTYDSDNAITSQTVRVGDLSNVNSYTAYLQVPYLFYQDFSSVSSFSDGYDNENVGTASALYKGIKELSQYSSDMTGWYATRIGVQGGTAARICCRYEDVLGSSAYYKGRLYTPFLSNIKDGSDVKISVSFRYGGDRKELLRWNFKYPLKSPMLYFGINTQENVINPDSNEGDLIDQITGMISGSGFSSMAPTSLSPMVIKGEAIPMGGNYTTFSGTRTVTIEGVDNGMRLGWILSTDCQAGSINCNYWLYIDDIKVQIVR